MSAPKGEALSVSMIKAIEIAKAGGERSLFRWPGGFWMGRARQAQEREIHSNYATTPTVNALIARGYLNPIAHMSRGDPWVCELTAKASGISP